MRLDPTANLDPRVRRTRQLLQDALDGLLQEKDFSEISVQDITDRATVNRATFYAHFVDKYALLEDCVSSRFYRLLSDRQVSMDGTCASGMRLLMETVCEFLKASRGACPMRHTQVQALVEPTIVQLIKDVVTKGMENHVASGSIPRALAVTSLSWAIYGAAREWSENPGHAPLAQVVDLMVELVHPLLLLSS